MARSNYWTNEDGIQVPFGPQVSDNLDAADIHTKGPVKSMKMYVDYSDLPKVGEAHTSKDFYIPAGAYIVSASYVSEVDFDNAVEFGTSQKDGTAIDQDGLIATGTTTAEGAGAQINTVVAEDAYLVVTETTTAPTTGNGKLFVEYII